MPRSHEHETGTSTRTSNGRVAGRARGQHAAPSRAAKLLPALLLVLPAGSLVGLKVMTAPAATAVTLQADAQHGPTPTDLPGPAGLDVPASEAVAPRIARPVPPVPSPRPARRASRTRRTAEWALPLHGRLSSPFGPRWGGFHPGIDIAAPTGLPISAAADGTVISAGWEGGYGYVVRLEHADGTRTVYAHMSRVIAQTGDRVGAGETIGLVGSTGFSTGPHLHFEVRINGDAVNPKPWLAERGVTVEG